MAREVDEAATQRRRNRAWACRFCMWSVVAVMRASIISSNNRTACRGRRALELPLELSYRLELELHPQAPPELHMRHPSINEPATSRCIHPCRTNKFLVPRLTSCRQGVLSAPTTSVLCGEKRDPSVGGSRFWMLFVHDSRLHVQRKACSASQSISKSPAGQ